MPIPRSAVEQRFTIPYDMMISAAHQYASLEPGKAGTFTDFFFDHNLDNYESYLKLYTVPDEVAAAIAADRINSMEDQLPSLDTLLASAVHDTNTIALLAATHLSENDKLEEIQLVPLLLRSKRLSRHVGGITSQALISASLAPRPYLQDVQDEQGGYRELLFRGPVYREYIKPNLSQRETGCPALAELVHFSDHRRPTTVFDLYWEPLVPLGVKKLSKRYLLPNNQQLF